MAPSGTYGDSVGVCTSLCTIIAVAQKFGGMDSTGLVESGFEAYTI